MTKLSANYASKLSLATALAEMGARAVTISNVVGVKPSDAQMVHEEVRGIKSQSGKTPTDHEWFLKTRTRRLHGAVFLLAYHSYRQAYSAQDDAQGLAFTLAYRDYLNMCKGKPLVPPERFYLLACKGFNNIKWKHITKGGSSCFSSGNVRVLKCRVCKLPHLAEEASLTFCCPTC